MSLEDLVKNTSVSGEPVDPQKVSNLIEPTQAMVDQVLEMYINGDDIKTIKKTVKTSEEGPKLTLSFAQIREIIDLYKRSLVESNE